MSGANWALIFAEQFAAGLVPFFLISGLLYVIFYLVLPRLLLHRKVQLELPGHADVRREILLSVQSMAIFGAVGVLIVQLYQHGWTQLYFHSATHGWGYFLFSILLVIVLQDAWFYWTHRLLHSKTLYKRVHSVHHQSHNPTPWAAFAFHPVEALIGAAIFPVVILILPLQVWAEGIWFLYMFVMSAYVHLGYEPMPRGFVGHWLTRWHTTELHHNMHHSDFRGNYGLYFTLWDQLMGTTHEDYENRFDEVTQGARPTAGAKNPRRSSAARARTEIGRN